MASTAVAHPERMRHGCNFWRKNVISLVFFRIFAQNSKVLKTHR